jgi:hypothetical protein
VALRTALAPLFCTVVFECGLARDGHNRAGNLNGPVHTRLQVELRSFLPPIGRMVMPMLSRQALLLGALVSSFGSAACSHDVGATGPVPWSDQRTQVTGSDRTFTALKPATGDACIRYQSACLSPSQKCGKDAVDIVLDQLGQPLDYVCYPAESSVTVTQLQAQQGTIAQRDNNAVVLLDSTAPLQGDVSIEGNNVVLYGSAPNAALVSGSLAIDGNNALVRGVRIKGDVHVEKNDATLAFCVIEGNVFIAGNNARLVACDVLGSVTVSGNNSEVYASRIVGGLSVPGKNADCKDDFAAMDLDHDHSIALSELGGPLDCK